MSFVLTHDHVMKEGRLLGAEALEPLRTVIVGGNAMHFPVGDRAQDIEHRYWGEHITYAYSQLPIAGFVDLKSVKVTADEALLWYAKVSARPIAGHPNRLRLNTEVAGSRGVRIGDVVRVEGISADVMAMSKQEEDDVSYTVVVLNRNLPPAQRDAEELDTELCLCVRGVEFNEFAADAKGVTLEAGIHLLTPDWAPDGEPEPLPVVAAAVRIHYRAWVATTANKVRVVTDARELAAVPGDDVPGNDLKQAVTRAFENSGGMPVAYIAVADPNDMRSWVTALNKIGDEYSIVPCSADRDVLAAVEDLIAQRSKDEVGRECVAWVSLPAPITVAVADASNSTDLEPLLGIVAATPGPPVIEVPARNGRFMSLGVRTGDVLRYGSDNYAEYVVTEVINEDTVVVQGRMLPCDSAVPISIWRKLDVDEQSTVIADRAASYQSKRIRAVWSNTVTAKDGTALEGWALCAALAGLRSGCAPHRDLTGVQISGLTVDTGAFDSDQLDMMSESGVWVVNTRDGKPTTRRAVTTAEFGDPTSADETIVTSLDSISKELRTELVRLLRKTPVTARFIGRITNKMRQKIGRMTGTRVPSLGPQLVAGEVEGVRRHVYLEDSLVLNVKLTIPRPHGHGSGTPQMEVHQKVIA